MSFGYSHYPRRTSSFRAAISAPLGDIIASTIFDLDATIEASYSGTGQTWANIEPTPADSSAQTDYDFFLGVDGSSATDDPTFNGAAGDAAAFWNHDGNDHFALKSGTNTDFLNGLHKTSGTGSGPWWFCIAFRTAPGAFSADGLFGTTSSALVDGIEIFIFDGATADVRVNVIRGSTFTSNDFGAGLANSTDFLICVSSDPTSTDDIRAWVNTTTKTVDTDANTNTSSTNAQHAAELAAVRDTGFQLAADSRTYHFSMGNAYLDDADIVNLKAHLETRHNRTYDT